MAVKKTIGRGNFMKHISPNPLLESSKQCFLPKAQNSYFALATLITKDHVYMHKHTQTKWGES